jgi:hypothetical protein
MSSVIEETALATRTESSLELAPTAAAAMAQYEIQSAIIIARKMPRNEDQAYQKLMKASLRTSFAEHASYSFPRGKKKDPSGRWVDNYVEGPSINIAREAARHWGNMRYGVEVLRDDEETRQIRAWAWDLETNLKISAEDDFKKLVQRKTYDAMGNKTGTNWIPADERELRELTNRRASILLRNCILQIMPSDFIEDARAKCTETLQKKAVSDPDGERKKVILAFSSISVTPEMLEQKLGHALGQCSPAEIADLRKIYKSIEDGNSTWAEYAEQPKYPDVKPAAELPKDTQAAPKTAAKQTSAPKKDKPAAPATAVGNPTATDDGDPGVGVDANGVLIGGDPFGG